MMLMSINFTKTEFFFIIVSFKMMNTIFYFFLCSDCRCFRLSLVQNYDEKLSIPRNIIFFVSVRCDKRGYFATNRRNLVITVAWRGWHCRRRVFFCDLEKICVGIGRYINEDMGYKQYSAYGSKILATLSQTLTWSHFLELVTIEDNNKRLFYQQMGIAEHWSVRNVSQLMAQTIILICFSIIESWSAW